MLPDDSPIGFLPIEGFPESVYPAGSVLECELEIEPTYELTCTTETTYQLTLTTEPEL